SAPPWRPSAAWWGRRRATSPRGRTASGCSTRSAAGSFGGGGRLPGGAAGALLYGLVFSFAAVYLPTTGNECCTNYSIVFTFVLMALVLAFRPQGLFGQIG